MAHFASTSDLHHLREISSAGGFWHEKDDMNDSKLNAFQFKGKSGPGLSLKALFNNVFTLKNLRCMALHAISVFGKV